MRLPWHKKESVKYIPVPSYGDHSRLWDDTAYLSKVNSMAGEMAWYSEISNAVSIIRTYADNAETNKELVGITKCLGVVKRLLVLKEIAADRKKIIDEAAMINNNPVVM